MLFCDSFAILVFWFSTNREFSTEATTGLTPAAPIAAKAAHSNGDRGSESPSGSISLP